MNWVYRRSVEELLSPEENQTCFNNVAPEWTTGESHRLHSFSVEKLCQRVLDTVFPRLLKLGPSLLLKDPASLKDSFYTQTSD